ncbi:PH-like domain-containing protein [Nocardia callitridis]|uniref:PH domain-containing protein n=1 Tax=Nocardia callitridis TaxID=648753 RepID=A0ABP9KDW5_9NOCA
MERTLWVVGLLALFLACLWLMYRSWRARERRQADRVGELPTVPAELGVEQLPSTTGVYLGSTFAPSWQDRIVVGDLGFRATTTLTGYAEGILLDRAGATPLWIPRSSVTVIRTERGHAGKVMTAGGVLVVRWTLPNGTEVDTGFRGDDKTVYSAWVTDSDGSKDASEQTGDDEG